MTSRGCVGAAALLIRRFCWMPGHGAGQLRWFKGCRHSALFLMLALVALPWAQSLSCVTAGPVHIYSAQDSANWANCTEIVFPTGNGWPGTDLQYPAFFELDPWTDPRYTSQTVQFRVNPDQALPLLRVLNGGVLLSSTTNVQFNMSSLLQANVFVRDQILALHMPNLRSGNLFVWGNGPVSVAAPVLRTVGLLGVFNVSESLLGSCLILVRYLAGVFSPHAARAESHQHHGRPRHGLHLCACRVPVLAAADHLR